MSDDFEQQEWVKLGVAAALARQYSGDQRVFLQRLADMLSAALPNETTVEHAGGLFTRHKPVKRINVNLGTDRFALFDPGYGNLEATRVKVVRGIALKTEAVTVPQMLEAVSDAIESRAQNSQAIRDALAELVD